MNLKNLFNRAKDQVDDVDSDKLKKDAKNVAETVKDKSGDIADKAKDTAGDVRDRAQRDRA